MTHSENLHPGGEVGRIRMDDHLDGMADVEYGSYDPKWPENSEHYHTWIDRDQDVMLRCGLGIRYGRCDHRRDGSTAWYLDNLEDRRVQIDKFLAMTRSGLGDSDGHDPKF